MMGDGDDGQVWGMGSAMGWGGWLMMTFFLILGLALVIGLWYTLLHSTPPGGRGPSADRTAAEQTLDVRFARGEIDQPEYEQRKRALSAR